MNKITANLVPDMTKLPHFRNLGIAILLLTFVMPADYVSGSVFAQNSEPIITSLSLTHIAVGVETEIAVSGINLITPTEATLIDTNGIVRSVLVLSVSENQLLLRTPPVETAGDYRLCVLFSTIQNCSTITAQSVPEYAIVSVIPNRISNDSVYQISIMTDTAKSISKVLLGSTELEIVEANDSTVEVDVPANILPGSYDLTLFDSYGMPATYPGIEVLNTITHEVTGVEPSSIKRYSRNQNLFLQGQNLDQIRSIRASGWLNDDCYSEIRPCDSYIVSSEELRIPLHQVYYATLGDIELTFSNGEVRVVNSPEVIDRVGPWDGSSQALFFIFLIASGVIWFFTMATDNRALSKFKRDLTAPRGERLIFYAFGTLSINLVLSLLLVAWWNGSESSILSNRFLLTTGLLSSNLNLLPSCAYVLPKFSKDFKNNRSLSTVTIIAVMLAATAIPFVFDRFQTTRGVQWAIYLQATILLGTVGFGFAVLSRTRRQLELENELRGPSDDELRLRLDRILHREGLVSARQHFEDVAESKVMQVFQSYYASLADTHNIELVDTTSQWLDPDLRLEFGRTQEVQQIQAIFSDLRRFDEELPDLEINKLVIRLAEGILGFIKGLDTVAYDAINSAVFHVVPITPYGLRSVLPDPTPIVIYHSETVIDEKDTEELRQILSDLDVKSQVSFLIVLGNSAIIKQEISGRIGNHTLQNVVVLEQRDFVNVLTQKNPVAKSLMQIIGEQVDLRIFSPYVVKGPTSSDMFYGRSAEINTILERIDHSSVAVIGARAIGKTSLMHTMRRLLEDKGVYVLHLDCYYINSYETLVFEIKNHWNIPGAELREINEIGQITSWLVELQRKTGIEEIVIQLDEIDRLLIYDSSYDRDELLFRRLRALDQENRCKFIFSGERMILNKLHDPQSPFFNFVTDVRLGLWDYEATQLFVRDTMERFVVRISNLSTVAKIIYQYSSGHPNLVQNICEASLRALGETDSRILTAEIVRTSVEDPSQEYGYLDLYQRIFWSQTNELERAISVYAAERGEIEDAEEIRSFLSSKGFEFSIGEFERGLEYLILCQLLTKTPNNSLRIKPQYFARTLFEPGYTVDDWIDYLRDMWQQE